MESSRTSTSDSEVNPRFDRKRVVLSRRSWTVRFYLWLWMADPDAINICKLFWGCLLAPFGLVLRTLVIPAIRRIDESERQRKMRKALSGAASGGDRAATFAQSHPRVLTALGASAIGVPAAGFVALCVLFPLQVLTVLGLGVALLGCVFVAVLAVDFIAQRRDRKPVQAVANFGRLMAMGAKAAKYRTCPIIEVRD